MSYDEKTGWSRLSPRQLVRYYNPLPGQPAHVEDRLEARDLPYIFDAYDNLWVKCWIGDLWVLLSGRPDTWQRPNNEPSETLWISITDLGAALRPPVKTSTVLKLLRDEGLTRRVDGRDVPTEQASGLYHEQEAEATSRFDLKPGTVQRLWCYEVLERLRSRTVPPPAQRPTPVIEPKTMMTVSATETNCQQCQKVIRPGEEALWRIDTADFACGSCASERTAAWEAA